MSGEATIVQALTELQRRVLLLHQPGEWFSAYSSGTLSAGGRELRLLGLLKWHDNPRVTADILTRRGVAVRAELVKEPRP